MIEAVLIGLMATEHVGHCRECNEIHPTISLVLADPWENVDTFASVYHNSYGGVSAFVGARFQGDLFFADVGLVTGYDAQAGAPVIPFGRAGIAYGGFEAFAFPSTAKGEVKLGLGVGYSIRIDLK